MCANYRTLADNYYPLTGMNTALHCLCTADANVAIVEDKRCILLVSFPQFIERLNADFRACASAYPGVQLDVSRKSFITPLTLWRSTSKCSQ